MLFEGFNYQSDHVSHVTWNHIVFLGTCPHKPHKSRTIFALEVGKGPYVTLIKLGVWGC